VQIIIVVVMSTFMLLLFTAGISWILIKVKEAVIARQQRRTIEVEED